jgi:aminopeptidase YwaD
MSRLADRIIASHQKIVKGDEWYAGDHAPFAFRGIPCMAVTSSDLFEGALEHTHTSKDTLDTIDFGMIKSTAQFLIEVISSKLR